MRCFPFSASVAAGPPGSPPIWAELMARLRRRQATSAWRVTIQVPSASSSAGARSRR